MSWKSFPSWTPAPLRRNVVLLVEWLRAANALKRSRSIIVLVVAGITLAALVPAFFSSRLAAAIAVLADYWLLTAVVTTVFASSSVARRRRRIRELHLQSWLIAAPIPQASVHASQMVRALLPTIAMGLGAMLLLLVSWMAAAAVSAGLLLGAIVGWRASAHASKARAPGSHYVRAKRTGTQALSAWPISQVRAWSRPENSRYVLVIALFAVQGGSSAVVGLAVVALYFIGSYLIALLSALMQVAKSASAWLRSTPMALSEFVWLLSRRALIHQVLGTSLATACMLVLGMPLMPVLQLAALWLSLVISVSGCALVDGYRGRSPLMKVALCFIAWGALLAVLQLRSPERA